MAEPILPAVVVKEALERAEIVQTYLQDEAIRLGIDPHTVPSTLTVANVLLADRRAPR